MPFVAIPNTCKLELVGQAAGQDVVNVLHYKYTSSTPNSSTLLSFVTAWLSAHKTQYLACHSQDYVLREVIATDIGVANGAQALVTLVTANNGSNASVLEPNNVAVVISWRTALTGRTNRGRSYIGGLPVNGFIQSTVVGALFNALATLATALIAQTFTGGFDLAVASKKDALAKVITGFILETISDSMRRRLPGRGA